MSELCIYCHLPESEHHAFEPPRRASAGCICDARTWGDPTNVPAVCGNFQADREDGYCVTCEHDQACHGGSGG